MDHFDMFAGAIPVSGGFHAAIAVVYSDGSPATVFEFKNNVFDAKEPARRYAIRRLKKFKRRIEPDLLKQGYAIDIDNTPDDI